MKPEYRSLTVILIILVLASASCGGSDGGSGGPSSLHAPVLSGSTYPTSAVQNQVKTVQIQCSFWFTDTGGDLTSLTVTVYGANGTVLGSETSVIEGDPGITEGSLSGTIDADTSLPGRFRLEFYATDSAGSRSNTVSTVFTVFPTAPLVSIAVTPTNARIIKGTAQQFTATGTYADNTVLDITSFVSWNSSYTWVATINYAGLATGQGGGSTTITATLSGMSGSISLVVADIPNLPLVSIAVTPRDQVITKGTTQKFTARGTFSNNTVADITTYVSWTSSDTNKSEIDAAGLATGKAVGSLTITATASGVSGSSTLKVVPAFAASVKYPVTTGSGLGNIALGDLNGDGRKDIAALVEWSTQVYLYYGPGSPQSVLTADVEPAGVAIADVNNDGLADLIMSGNSSTTGPGPLGRVYVYKSGSGESYALSIGNAGPLAVADLNNDGLPDIVVAGTDSAGNGMISFLFQGVNGALGQEVTYTGVPVYSRSELHVADMNNDGMNDIVLQSGAKQLAVVKQVSAGAFSAIPDYYTIQTSNFNSFALGDLNGDGRVDIAVSAMAGIGSVNIFLQNADGQLTGSTLLTASPEPNEVDIADVDGDGLNDVILLKNGNDIRILYQTANHAFSNYIQYYLQTQTTGGTFFHEALSVGDVTGDGLPDIVASWSGEGVYVLPSLP